MLKLEWTKKHTTILIYTCITLLLAIAIIFTVLFPGRIFGALGSFCKALSPVFFGFIIAYLLNPCADFFDKKLFSRLFKKGSKRLARILAVTATFILFFAIIALFIGILVPQVISSYSSLESKFEVYVSKASEWLSGFISTLRENDEYGLLSVFLGSGDVGESLGSVINSAFGFIGNVADKVLIYSSAAVGIAAKVIVSFIFAVYFLLEKERLFTWFAKLADALFPQSFNNRAHYWISYTDNVFSSFITGKLLNAFLITVINFIVFGICGIPYYPLVALITGITDMIPYFGPFIGAIPCGFIILIADPIKLIWFAVLVLIIQQIDGNIVGPKILGEKVGVDSLLIIVAITVGGGLFGIAGMFVGVPVFTVIYHAINTFISSRLKKKERPTSSKAYEKDVKDIKEAKHEV